jgi:hypothetical protein
MSGKVALSDIVALFMAAGRYGDARTRSKSTFKAMALVGDEWFSRSRNLRRQIT